MADADTVIYPYSLPDSMPPTADELPEYVGEPVESFNHLLCMTLLLATLRLHFEGVRDAFIAGNMAVFYGLAQSKARDFLSPDIFVVLDVPPGPRRSWVVWEEEGRAPDVVMELLSDSTMNRDMVTKRDIYERILRVPEYFWFNPRTGAVGGLRLDSGRYVEIEPVDSRLYSVGLDLYLAPWTGIYAQVQGVWPRWQTADGTLVSTPEEVAYQERQRADVLAEELARYRERFGDLA